MPYHVVYILANKDADNFYESGTTWGTREILNCTMFFDEKFAVYWHEKVLSKAHKEMFPNLMSVSINVLEPTFLDNLFEKEK